jgi:hypothetical protein
VIGVERVPQAVARLRGLADARTSLQLDPTRSTGGKD